jgi:branched-chain amino acid transport system permease protein
MELNVIWAGILSGALYGLVAQAYFLIFRATRVLSFAVGGASGLAGVAAATWSQQPPAVAAAFGVVLAVAATLVTDVLILRPVQSREVGHFGTVLALAAALFVMIQLTARFFTQMAVIGQPLVDSYIALFGQTFTAHSVLTVLISLGVTGALVVWLKRGRQGRLLDALGDNAEAATALALPVGTVRVLAVTLAGLAAGLAGVLDAGRAPMTFQTGFDLSLVGFLAVVIGGTDSAWGPLIGGLLLGLLESIGARVIGAQWGEYLFLGVVLIAFRLRPQGIFATSVRHWD